MQSFEGGEILRLKDSTLLADKEQHAFDLLNTQQHLGVKASSALLASHHTRSSPTAQAFDILSAM